MSQLNRNVNYLFNVDGITPWERLRVIRNFLDERVRALKLAELNSLKTKSFVEKLDQDSFEYQEYLIGKDFNESLVQDCRDEVEFLREFEQRIASEAEKTRIPGKSDREMYELNYYEEAVQMLMLDSQSEFMATGAISPNTMKRLIQNPIAMDRVVQLGILANTALETSIRQPIQQLMIGEVLRITTNEPN